MSSEPNRASDKLSVDFNGIPTVTGEAIFKAAACVLAESRMQVLNLGGNADMIRPKLIEIIGLGLF